MLSGFVGFSPWLTCLPVTFCMRSYLAAIETDPFLWREFDDDTSGAIQSFDPRLFAERSDRSGLAGEDFSRQRSVEPRPVFRSVIMNRRERSRCDSLFVFEGHDHGALRPCSKGGHPLSLRHAGDEEASLVPQVDMHDADGPAIRGRPGDGAFILPIEEDVAPFRRDPIKGDVVEVFELVGYESLL